MDNIFPFILETLSSKPLSEETEKKLLMELRQKLKNEDIKIKNFKNEFNQALEVGQNLGIFRLVGENISLPFSLGNKTSKPESKPSSRSKSAVADKEHRSSRRGRRRSSSRRRQGRSRSRSGTRARSQRRRRSSRR